MIWLLQKICQGCGRDHIETGYYLEKYFPLHNVRYVAINDGYDSCNIDNSANDFAPFKNVFNDMYCKDISKKVRAALYSKQLEGSYLGTSAPFGYKKSNIKGKLEIDTNTAPFIKRIFNEYINDKSIRRIAIDLTKDKVPTPSQYSKVRNTQTIIKGAWNDTTVRRILKNQVYIGHTIQNKSQKINYKINKTRKIPVEQWIVVKNTHEPLISIKDFNLVQDILNTKSYIPKKREMHLLTGFLFCAECGSRVTFLARHQKEKYYCICNMVKQFSYLKKCSMKCVHEEDVEKALKDTLKDLANQYVDKEYIIKNINTNKYNELQIQKQEEKRKIEGAMNECSQMQMNLYKDKVSGLIDNDIFTQLSSKIKEDREILHERLITIEKEISRTKLNSLRNDSFLETLNQFLTFENLDRNILNILLDKILIHKSSTDCYFQIYFKFTDKRIKVFPK